MTGTDENLNRWEKTVKERNGRLYILWRYLNATGYPDGLDAMPEKLLATMKNFLGGSRALQRQLYMRYWTTWDKEWEDHYISEWEYAVARGSKEARRIRTPELVADGRAHLQTDGRNRVKEIMDALQASSSIVAKKA